jgi:rare lipoprotein A
VATPGLAAPADARIRRAGWARWGLWAQAAAVGLLAALVAGCASGPAPERDGPGADPPARLDQVPDAVPRAEPLRVGGPNKPYEVLGQRYAPFTQDLALRERGGASWYGRKFHGKPTASGEPYDMYAMTAAHKTMPIPSYARVRNPANGREVVVRINDRGPFVAGRVIDLSYTAALKLGVLAGVAPVEVERLTLADIRSGAWRRDRTLALPEPAGGQVEPLPTAPTAGSATAETTGDGVPLVEPGPGWWLQVGAFRQAEGAGALRQRVQREAAAWAPGVAVVDDRATLRVQVGPFASRREALAASDRLAGLLLVQPLLVERRAP